MILAFIGGLILGSIFFFGLYYTSKKVSQVKNPAFFMLASVAIRMTILISGLYFIYSYRGLLTHFLLAIGGVFLAKYIIVKIVKKGVL